MEPTLIDCFFQNTYVCSGTGKPYYHYRVSLSIKRTFEEGRGLRGKAHSTCHSPPSRYLRSFLGPTIPSHSSHLFLSPPSPISHSPPCTHFLPLPFPLHHPPFSFLLHLCFPTMHSFPHAPPSSCSGGLAPAFSMLSNSCMSGYPEYPSLFIGCFCNC